MNESRKYTLEQVKNIINPILRGDRYTSDNRKKFWELFDDATRQEPAASVPRCEHCERGIIVCTLTDGTAAHVLTNYDKSLAWRVPCTAATQPAPAQETIPLAVPLLPCGCISDGKPCFKSCNTSSEIMGRFYCERERAETTPAAAQQGCDTNQTKINVLNMRKDDSPVYFVTSSPYSANTTAEMKYPAASVPPPATPDAEPDDLAEWRRSEGDYPHKLICNGDRHYPAGSGKGCSCFNTIPFNAIWASEHDRRMAEKDAEWEANFDNLGSKKVLNYWLKEFGLAEPPPEERVKIEQRGNVWYVYLDNIQHYAGKESTAKALHYGLIAQLEGTI